MTAIIVTILVLAVDQLTKTLVASGSVHARWIAPDLNPDLALGVLGGPSAVEIAAATIALGFAVVALRHMRLRTHSAIALGFVVGGSLGNLVDRIAYGAVRDFLSGPWVLFNLADVALVLGLMALVALWIGDRRRLSDR